MKRIVRCSLVINVSMADVPILRYTIPHILSSHKVEFSDMVLVIDERPIEGRIGQQGQHSLTELLAALDAIRQMGYEFRQVRVDYSSAAIQDTFYRWFGHDHVGLRCAGGTPIYAFLFGLDQAREDFRLHLDSDMLVHDPGPRSWVGRAIEIIKEYPEILFVNQTFGPQCKDDSLHPFLAPYHPGLGQRVAQTFSTRCFLFNMAKLRSQFLPIEAIRHPFLKTLIYRVQGRSPFVALEEMIAHRLRATGTYRCDLDRSWGFNLHAWNKQVFHDPRIGDVIRCVQQGKIPPGQCGKPNLDFGAFF